MTRPAIVGALILASSLSAFAGMAPTSSAVAETSIRDATDRAGLKRRCGGDYATFCGDLPPDGPEVQACFRDNRANLSPACRAEIDRVQKDGRKG